MKGIVFNLLEDVVTARHGPDAWPDLIDAAGVGGAYTSLGSYPDDDMVALVNTAAAVLVQSPADVLRWFGRSAMPLLATRFAHLFASHTHARSFVGSVNAIIHPEVRKLYSGAGCPHFHFSDREDGALIIGYHSPRRLCALAEGFVLGASDHYGETVAIDHLACMSQGQPLCRLAVRWPA
ncbi:heme NO-binding domain-containing protein [Novosphingobium sp. FSW06-99]|uniref:heme NO-binding domain-containing protein n=1 Tax=Novosphingobium sp. FSW06-99 TaxID=1739113 RepID=UPI00076D011E|nr:heme NO-binding domain-containing protein [Novosphingobium sp. FSW06-99]KUR73412.1 heme NO-binding protein [Novosphingobium sp. FSW06-99]